MVVFDVSTDMCVSTIIRTGANMGWDMILVPDACDCFDLPDGKGGTIKGEDIHGASCGDLSLRILPHHSDLRADGIPTRSVAIAKGPLVVKSLAVA